MKIIFNVNITRRLLNILLLLFLSNYHSYSQNIEECVLKPSEKKLKLLGKKEGKKPLYFINNKEVLEKYVLGLDCISIDSIEVINPKKAEIKYGKKGRNGAILIKTHKNWKANKVFKANSKTSIYSFLKTQKNRPGVVINIDKALIVVDDNISNKKIIDSIPFDHLVRLKLLIADDEDALKYGDAAKNGVVLIQTKKPFLDFLEKHKSHLFVLNGRPVSLEVISNIHPSKIKSIDVLKEKPSTAIYGSRGANGAVLVTLKKTEKN